MQRKCLSATLLLGLASSPAALGQFEALVTDFEGSGYTPFVDEIVFRDPTVSGTTIGVDPDPNWPEDTYLTDIGLNPFSRVSSGARASETVWAFLEPGNHTSWVRLVTSGATDISNPSLHLEGKVRMWIAVQAWSDTFATPVTDGHLYVGIGVRETGQGVHQGGDGGTGGDIEWVGLDAKLVEILAGPDGVCDTTADPNSDDIQVNPVGASIGADGVCVDAGPDGELQTDPPEDKDDIVATTPRGMFRIPTDGVIREYVFDLPALETAGKVFPFTGDATLGAEPNNRGTLEHLVLGNDPTNGDVNAKLFLVNVDDIQFEAPILDPPTIENLPPPRPLDESVMVKFIKDDADLVEVFKLNADGSDTLIGSVDTGIQTEQEVDTTPLGAGLKVVARQTVGGDVSDFSTPVVVSPQGNGPLRIAMAIRETDEYDHALGCGADGTGFDPDQLASLEFVGASDQDDGFGIPTAPRFTPQLDWFEIVFNPCDETYGVAQFSGDGELTLSAAPASTDGVWEGLYFRIDELSPTVGPFTVYIDDVAAMDESGVICLVDDFESYTPGDFIIEPQDGDGTASTVAAPTDVQIRSPGSSVNTGEKIVGPGPDGTLETEPDGDDVIDALHARFNNPGVAGTSQGLADEPDQSAVTDEDAFSGSQSLKVEWAFLDASNLRSVVRLTTNGTVDPITPPETFENPDPVIPLSLDGTLCDGEGDIWYSVMVKLAPPAIPGDCDEDGDVDLNDVGCMQLCYGTDPAPIECEKVDIAPSGEPDGAVDFADVSLFQFLFIGPAQ